MATQGSILQRIPDWCCSLEGPRKFVLNGLVLIFSLLGTVVIVKATFKQVYVLDAISVPKDLEANGYTSVTVGQRIIDAVSEINRLAATTRQVGIYALSEADPSRPDSADFDGPGQHSSGALEVVALSGDDSAPKYDVSVGGVSLNTLIFYVRDLLGMSDTKISGEIVAEKPPTGSAAGKDNTSAATKYSIRLRVSDKGLVQPEGEATDQLATLFEDGALKLVERFDPLNAGYYSYYKRDYENALRIARSHIARGSEDDRQWALNLLGMVSHARFRHDEARAQKGYDDAIAAFAELRQSYPQFAPGLFNLSVTLTDKGELLQQQNKDAAYQNFKDAREVALQGLRIEEGKGGRGSAVGFATAGNALRAMARWEAARYDDALRYFNLSVKANPMFVYAYLSEGNIFYSRHAPEEANAKYQLATEICPSAQTFTRVGALLLKNGQTPDAVPMFQRAAELKPSSHAFTYWGMALRDSGRIDEAKDQFEKAIATDPNTPNGYNQYGLMYLGQKNWDAAIEQFVMAIKASPRWSNYHYNLGLALRGAGRLDQAIAAFERTIAIYPRHAWAYAQLGATLAEQYQQALGGDIPPSVAEPLAKALEIKPNDAVVLGTIGDAYQLLNLPERANEFRLRAAAATENASTGLRADVEQNGRMTEKF
jgi:tetratricopeptide (TPR) repeat protein